MDVPHEWLPRPDVLDALEAHATELPPTRVWRAVVLRRGQSPNDITAQEVLRHSVGPARWNPKNVPALYTALSRPTAAAEGAQLRRQHVDEDVASTMTLTIRAIEVRLKRVVDLRDPAHFAVMDLDEHELRSSRRNVGSIDELTQAQRIGGAVWYLGYAGLLVPSVQIWPEPNLVIFSDRLGETDYYELPSEPSPNDAR